MKTVFKKYRLIINEQEQDISVKIFPHEQSLRRHLEGHILSEMEPWDRVFSRQQLTDARKNLLDNNVISRETYGDIVEVVDDAIQYALKEPLYVWAEQIVEEEGKSERAFIVFPKTASYWFWMKRVYERCIFVLLWAEILRNTFFSKPPGRTSCLSCPVPSMLTTK